MKGRYGGGRYGTLVLLIVLAALLLGVALVPRQASAQDYGEGITYKVWRTGPVHNQFAFRSRPEGQVRLCWLRLARVG